MKKYLLPAHKNGIKIFICSGRSLYEMDYFDISSIKKDANVKANWTVVKFIVTFDGNGGTLTSGEEIQNVVKATYHRTL